MQILLLLFLAVLVIPFAILYNLLTGHPWNAGLEDGLIFLKIFGTLFAPVWIPMIVITIRHMARRRAEKREWRLQAERDRQREAQEKQQIADAVEADRHASLREYSIIVKSFRALISECEAPWDELMRVGRAARGNAFPSHTLLEAVEFDLHQILRSFLVAIGEHVPNALGKICLAALIGLKKHDGMTASDCIAAVHRTEHQSIGLPLTVGVLSHYEGLMGMRASFDGTAALAFHALVEVAAKSCPNSRPVELVRRSYLNISSPSSPKMVPAAVELHLVRSTGTAINAPNSTLHSDSSWTQPNWMFKPPTADTQRFITPIGLAPAMQMCVRPQRKK